VHPNHRPNEAAEREGDPKRMPIERLREIRDELRIRVEALLDAEGWR
jgi:hypothetical protein